MSCVKVEVAALVSPSQIVLNMVSVDDEMMLNVRGCRLTYMGQAETNAEAWFNKSLRPRKPKVSLGRTAQDGHLDSHTAPELCGRKAIFEEEG